MQILHKVVRNAKTLIANFRPKPLILQDGPLILSVLRKKPVNMRIQPSLFLSCSSDLWLITSLLFEPKNCSRF